jgi:hypothetical protein
VVDGRRLTFRLAGINNQNFIMRDEQTGTWWQQVNGRAFHGALTGKRLRLVPHDEVTFATWKGEQHNGRVLQKDPRIQKEDNYEPADWETHMSTVRVPAGMIAGPVPRGLVPRTLMVGITLNNRSVAWPHASILKAGATGGDVGGVPVVIVAAPDGKSVRVFDRRVDGVALTFVRAGIDAKTSTLLDLETLSEWDFTGRAHTGAHAGAQLARVDFLLDYWFDWKNYHHDTGVVVPWAPKAQAKKAPSKIPPPS